MPTFGQIWPKTNLTGGSKSFGTHVTLKPPRHLVRIEFWLGMGSNGPKKPIFCQKSQFWAKFGPRILIILRGSKSSGTHRSENHLGALFALFFGRAQQQMDQKGRYLAQNGPICSFWAQFARFLGQNPIFFLTREREFWYSYIRKTTRHLVPNVFLGRTKHQNGPERQVFGPND